MSEIIWDHWEYFWCVDLLCIKTIDCKLCMHWLFDSTDNYIETLHVVCGFLSHSLSYILKLWKHDISWKLHSIFFGFMPGPRCSIMDGWCYPLDKSLSRFRSLFCQHSSTGKQWYLPLSKTGTCSVQIGSVLTSCFILQTWWTEESLCEVGSRLWCSGCC